VRRALGANPASAKEAESARGWVWRLWLSLATVTAVIITLLIPLLVRPSTPLIQVATLETTGAARGNATNEVASTRVAPVVSSIATWMSGVDGRTNNGINKVIITAVTVARLSHNRHTHPRADSASFADAGLAPRARRT